MSTPSPLVCLVTPGHLTSTPRVLKEAAALLGAGYRVHVVAGRHYAPVDPLDELVLAGVAWPCTRVDYRSGVWTGPRRLLRRLARTWLRHGGRASVALCARAQLAESTRLARAAAAVRADLYIGHCLGGLAAAGAAAGRVGASLGFDAEDYHDEETAEALSDPVERVISRTIQEHYLPGCRHLTAASPLIAGKYARQYGVTPTTILNVFPRDQGPAESPAGHEAGRPRRLYWFSQTIGPGRGLEAVLTTLPRMRTPCELHLRGFIGADYRSHLLQLAERVGCPDSIVILPPGPAEDMARLAAGADLGLSTEESSPPNRDICLTNKIFVYLLAGVPQLLSSTTAQRALAPELGAAALLCDLARPEETARRLDDYFSSPERIAASRRHAWTLGRTRYCWDVEKDKFLASVALALSSRPAA